MINFGEFVRDLRIKNGLTLRNFCRITNIDPSNRSKIERGILPSPRSKKVLQEIASVLNLSEESEDYNTLFELATIGHIPLELLDNQRVFDKLPVFFRTLRGEKPNREELKKLVKLLEEE